MPPIRGSWLTLMPPIRGAMSAKFSLVREKLRPAPPELPGGRLSPLRGAAAEAPWGGGGGAGGGGGGRGGAARGRGRWRREARPGVGAVERVAGRYAPADGASAAEGSRFHCVRTKLLGDPVARLVADVEGDA